MIDLLLKFAKVTAFVVLVLFLSQLPIRGKRICDHFGDNMHVRVYAAKLAEKFNDATVWMSHRIRHQERGIAYAAKSKVESAHDRTDSDLSAVLKKLDKRH